MAECTVQLRTETAIIHHRMEKTTQSGVPTDTGSQPPPRSVPGTSRQQAMVAVAAAAFLFGTAGVARGLGPDDLSSVVIGGWRTILGGLGLVALAAVTGRAPWRHRFRPSMLIGGLAVVAYQLSFFLAIERIGVAAGTVIAIGTSPLAAGLLDYAYRGQKPTARWFAGVVAAIAGIALLSVDVSGSSGPGFDMIGGLFAFAAGVGYPIYGLITQQLMEDRPPLAAMSSVSAIGAVLAIPVILVAGGPSPFGTVGGTTMILYLGFVATSLAYALWSSGLRTLALRDTVTLTLVEPVAASVLAVAVLGESLTLQSGLAIPVILAGVVIATMPAPRSRRTAPV